jgi:hypothetical protein
MPFVDHSQGQSSFCVIQRLAKSLNMSAVRSDLESSPQTLPS